MIGSVWLSPTGGAYSVVDGPTNGYVTFGNKNSVAVSELLANWEVVQFEAGSTWKHKKSGTLYEIVLVANRHSDRIEFALTIVYKSDELKLHACSAASFYRRMQHD